MQSLSVNTANMQHRSTRNPLIAQRRLEARNLIDAFWQYVRYAPFVRKLELVVLLLIALVGVIFAVVQLTDVAPSIRRNILPISLGGALIIALLGAINIVIKVEHDMTLLRFGWLSSFAFSDRDRLMLMRESVIRSTALSMLFTAAPLWAFQIYSEAHFLLLATAIWLFASMTVTILVAERALRLRSFTRSMRRPMIADAMLKYDVDPIRGLVALTWADQRTRLITMIWVVLLPIICAAVVRYTTSENAAALLLILAIASHIMFVTLFRSPNLIFSPFLQLSGRLLAELVLGLARFPLVVSTFSYVLMMSAWMLATGSVLFLPFIGLLIVTAMNILWVGVSIAFPDKPKARQFVYLIVGSLAGAGAIASPLLAIALLIGALVFFSRKANNRYKGRVL